MQDARQFFSVTQLNEYVRMLLDGNAVLSDIWIKGEISNFTNQYRTGHMYFSVKDAGATLRVVMFRSHAARLQFEPKDGMKVLLHGRVSAYVAGGQYQFYADVMEAEGLGSLYLAFEQCKARLQAEGLFAPERKKPIPALPRRVGIITSPTGAAIRDIINVTGRRYPQGELLIFPSLVQGAEAAAYLRGGIQYFNAVREDPEQAVDLIIIGRGGGSAEDLWAFNDESLARTIAASEIPVISAVGHEVDFTICDFVADLRAATPSAAAELALPDRTELSRRVNTLATRMQNAEATRLRTLRTRVQRLSETRVLTSPEGAYRVRRETVEGLEKRLNLSMSRRLAFKRQSMERVVASLSALNPLAVLSRGYALVQDGEGKVVPTVGQLSVGDRVHLRFADGSARVSVEEIED